MKIGYARVSTRDQNLDLQVDALKQAGCTEIYKDVASGAKTARPALDQLLGILRAGDVLVIWKLDRMGRSLKHLVELVGDLVARNIGLLSLNDPIDTTNAQGRLVFNLFASLAEFERELIRERTKAGLTAARARGRIGGRPKGLSPQAEATALAAETLYRERRLSVNAIAKQLHLSKGTLYSYLRRRNVEVGSYEKTATAGQLERTRVVEEPNPEAAISTKEKVTPKTGTVVLHLRIGNNNKFVRGKKRVIESIEQYHLAALDAQRQSTGVYTIKVTYSSDKELDTLVDDLLREIALEADMRNCFSESDAHLEGSELCW